MPVHPDLPKSHLLRHRNSDVYMILIRQLCALANYWISNCLFRYPWSIIGPCKVFSDDPVFDTAWRVNGQDVQQMHVMKLDQRKAWSTAKLWQVCSQKATAMQIIGVSARRWNHGSFTLSTKGPSAGLSNCPSSIRRTSLSWLIFNSSYCRFCFLSTTLPSVYVF